jgi:hypothetical protein
MKTLLIASIIGIAVLFGTAGYAVERLPQATTPAVATKTADTGQAEREALIKECARRHMVFMSKPAVRNERRCWLAHRHLMD